MAFNEWWNDYWNGKKAELQSALSQLRTRGSACIDVSDITTASRRKLFSIGLNFQNDLDSGKISNNLLLVLKNKIKGLSQNLSILREKSGNRWLVIDKGNKPNKDKGYSIREESGILNVYECRKELLKTGEREWVKVIDGKEKGYKSNAASIELAYVLESMLEAGEAVTAKLEINGSNRQLKLERV